MQILYNHLKPIPMKTTILDTPYNLSLLAELGKPDVHQPQISQLVEALYLNMFGAVVDQELEQESIQIKTRIFKMIGKEGIYKGKIIKKRQQVVVWLTLKITSFA